MDSIYMMLMLIIMSLASPHTTSLFCDINPQVMSKRENADFVIGGLFPFHFENEGKFHFNTPGITWSEAMKFAIDNINKDSEILPNMTLGYEIYDTCNTIHIAIETALRLTSLVDAKNTTTCTCNRSLLKSVVALVGDAASATTTRVASIFSALRIPQISYSATSIDLSAKHLYPSFLRTIPPDNFQANALTNLMIHFQWSYINVIACDDNYGRVGSNALLPLLAKYNICVATYELYDVKGDINGTMTASVIEKLKAEKEATTIVLWCQRPDAMKVLRKADELDLYGRTWIATEAYALTSEMYEIDPRVIKGLLGLIPAQNDDQDFENFLSQQTPRNFTRTPWLEKYWETKGCKKINSKYECPNKKMNLGNLPKSKYMNVIHAVYAIARALHKYVIQKPGEDVQPKILLDLVKSVNFPGNHGVNISFDSSGDPGTATYSLVNLKLTSSSRMLYHDVVGTSTGGKVEFYKNKTLQYSTEKLPPSTCREYCEPGFAGKVFGNKPCCWRCVRCDKDEVQPKPNQQECHKCRHGDYPNINRTKCLTPDYEHFIASEARNATLILLTIISSLFIIACISIIIKYRTTPVVKALNYRLSLLQMFSMLILTALPLPVFLVHRNSIGCMVQLYYFLFFYVIAISVTFTKADLLLRIFKASKSGILSKHNRMKKNNLQYITVFSLTVTGILMCTILYFTFRPSITEEILSVTHDKISIDCYCDQNYDSVLFITLGYIGIISLICGVYAFKARKLPSMYNEARYTSFAMFIFVLTWMMFIPLYYSTESKFARRIIWCYISLVANLSVFILMYVPKVFTIIFRPEENTREKFRERMRPSTGLEIAADPKIRYSNSTITTLSPGSSVSETPSPNQTHI